MDRSHHGMYGAGNANLDRDHEILLDLIEQMRRPNIDSVAVATVLLEMRAYTDAHFEHEEELMDRYGYPDAAAHKAAHQQFAHQLDALLNACSLPSRPMQGIGEIVEDWLQIHICGVDARFGEYLKQFAVAPCAADAGVFADSAG
jgi:hemerythrin-like metal-binding protein